MSYTSINGTLFSPSMLAGEEDGNRDTGESEMDTQGEKTRHAAVGPDEWDGPSKKSLHINFLLQCRELLNLPGMLLNLR